MNSLPELPPGWAWAKVREVGDLKLGRQRSPEHHDGPHMRPYLRVANVYDARLDLADVLRMNFTPDEFGIFQLRPGDILVNEGQSLEWVGRSAIYRGEVPGACFQNTLIRFRAKPFVLPEFALLVFRHHVFSQRFRQIAKWTTNIAHLGMERFAEVEFPVPPMNEQRRIVNEADKQLTRLEAGVDTLKRVQTHLKRYRASVLKAACEGRLVPTEAELARREKRDYESADRLLERILQERRARWDADHLAKMKATGKTPANDQWKIQYEQPRGPVLAKLPKLPEGWVWASLSQLAGDCSYGTSVKCDYGAPGPDVLRIPNVVDGDLSIADLKRATEMLELSMHAYVAPRDLLIIRTNGSKDLVGRGAIVKQPLVRPTYFASYLIRFRILDDHLARYIGAVWHSPTMRRWLTEHASNSAGQHNINMSNLAAMPIPLPPRDEARRITHAVEQAASILSSIANGAVNALARADRLRQSILKRAFAGRLVVQSPADEPTIALFERIRDERPEPSPRGRRDRADDRRPARNSNNVE